MDQKQCRYSMHKIKILFHLYFKTWKHQKIKGGDNLPVFTVNPAFLNQEINADFFDFQFVLNADWSMKECKYWDQILEPAIWQSLFLVREKYMRKVKQHKFDKKKIEAHKEEKEKMLNAWKVQKEHYQWHIRYQEKALWEKNRLLKAIWLIAHNVEKVNQN